MEKLILEPQYVTVDDFNNYHGVNLREILRNDGNDSYQAERFLAREELKFINWIDNTTFRRLPYSQLNERQLKLFRCAILEQVMYVIKNGDIGLDSGYDPEKGVIADSDTLNSLRVSQVAIDLLSNAGLFNLVMKNRPRKFGGGFVPGDFF